MGSTTFHNLRPEKKERIIHAALAEFSARPFNEASITNIVKNANISRGSFYQYFDNKEKIYNYLVKYVYTKHRQDLFDLLVEHSGQLYDALIEFYDTYIDELVQSEYFTFYKNTFLYVSHHLIGEKGIFSLSNQTSNRAEEQQQFLKVIDMSHLKTGTDAEVLDYIYFTVNVIHHMVIDGFVNDLSLEEIKNRSFQAVNWLYYGIQNGSQKEE